MRRKYLIPIAALLLLAGCHKTPTPATDTSPDPSTDTVIVSEFGERPTVTVPVDFGDNSTESASELTDPVETAETIPTSEVAAIQQTEPAPTVPAQTEPATPTPSNLPKPTDPPDPPKPTEPTPTQPQPTQPAHVHSYKSTVVAPTCTAKGYTEHQCACGDSYRDNYVDVTGHSFTEQSVAATCTSGGYTLKTCSRCGETETTNTTPALGHDYRDTVIPPTTTSEGYTEHKCSRCGDFYRDNYTEKLHEVFDLQAVIDYGNAYAQSLGFTVDKSMTLANSSHYPGYYGSGYSLDFLKQEAAGNVKYTYDSLIALGDTIPGFRCNIHASYEPDTDKYYIVFLYG